MDLIISSVESYIDSATLLIALYRGTIPVLCIVGPRVSLQYMGLALYKPLFERMEGTILPSHSSAGLAGVSMLCLTKRVHCTDSSSHPKHPDMHGHYTGCYSW